MTPSWWVGAATTRLKCEAAAACVSGGLALVTLAWRDWIEFLLRVDPDHGSGALEWAIVAILCVTSIAFAVLANRERLRAVPGGTEG